MMWLHARSCVLPSFKWTSLNNLCSLPDSAYRQQQALLDHQTWLQLKDTRSDNFLHSRTKNAVILVLPGPKITPDQKFRDRTWGLNDQSRPDGCILHYTNRMHKTQRNYLRFVWSGKTYQFNCLPFGLSSAPWVFTKTLKPVAALLLEMGSAANRLYRRHSHIGRDQGELRNKQKP